MGSSAVRGLGLQQRVDPRPPAAGSKGHPRCPLWDLDLDGQLHPMQEALLQIPPKAAEHGAPPGRIAGETEPPAPNPPAPWSPRNGCGGARWSGQGHTSRGQPGQCRPVTMEVMGTGQPLLPGLGIACGEMAETQDK